mmetsp:Transcript_11416/g.12961  ORF Transcript_11416/g.12961 Transcript_11416/m.12961 type:complete len:218 (+) Transcript_11416:48-701(+)
MDNTTLKANAAKIYIEGHRGGKLDYENTLPAFKQAIDHNLPGVEFDLWLTKDKIPVVIHGTEGAIGFKCEEAGVKEDDKIVELTLEQIKSVTLPNGERIPTFEELLQLCAKKLKLNIEIKDDNIEICKIVLDLLADFEVTNEYAWFTSFKYNILEEIKTLNPSFELGYLYKSDESMNSEFYPTHGDSCNIPYNHLTKELVEKCHENGLKVAIYYPKI